MAYRFDAAEFTTAREVTQGGSHLYLVWTKRGPAVVEHNYEATSATDAIRQAREELRTFERGMNTIFPSKQ